ncbi:MAG: patatin family protein [Lachnospiraceae bacterium]|nr:patatin family protein [Lachnospiraceae bacterium]
MKTGLVLEGGAMRGLFSAGILDILMREEITVDGTVGVSAGACFGCNYKSKQVGRAIRYNLEYCNDPRFCSMKSLRKTGDLYGAEFCYHEIPEKLDLFDYETYQSNPMVFYVCATDINTGTPVYPRLDKCDWEDLEWMRASASMPLVSNIVKVGGLELLDGGMSDSIPLRFMQESGYEKNVVVLTQPRSYVKSKNKALPFIRIKYRKYPKLIEAIERRQDVYNETLEYIRQEEKKGTVLVLAPAEALPVERVSHDKVALQACYDEGIRVGEENIEKIRAFLAE